MAIIAICMIGWRQITLGGIKMPVYTISDARNKLSSLRHEAAQGKEILLEDAKRKDDQPVSLIATFLIDSLCEEKTFSFEWVDTPGQGGDSYSLWNKETNTFGIGRTRKEAIRNFLDNIEEYASVYFDDLPFFLSKNNPSNSHYWYLRRVLRCSNRSDLVNMLGLGEHIE
jgi:hypothetical protein